MLVFVLGSKALEFRREKKRTIKIHAHARDTRETRVRTRHATPVERRVSRDGLYFVLSHIFSPKLDTPNKLLKLQKMNSHLSRNDYMCTYVPNFPLTLLYRVINGLRQSDIKNRGRKVHKELFIFLRSQSP